MTPRITARSLTLPQQRAQETRVRILQAAARAFARRGYQAATVDDIAVEAGISMGALYHHFSSKEALFRAILDENISRGLGELGSAMATAPSFHEAIRHFVAYFFREFESRRELSSLSMEFWALAAREPWAADVVRESIRQGRALIRQALAAAREAGIVRGDLDIESAATLLLATVEGIGVLYAVDPDSITARKHAKSWTDLIERFIQADRAGDLNEFQTRMAAVVRQGTSGTNIEGAEHG